jgi:hypothetical protein
VWVTGLGCAVAGGRFVGELVPLDDDDAFEGVGQDACRTQARHAPSDDDRPVADHGGSVGVVAPYL